MSVCCPACSCSNSHSPWWTQVWDKGQRAFVSAPHKDGTPGCNATGPYDALDSGKALAVRELIEDHRDRMLTIRRRDFEVVNMLLESHTIFVWSAVKTRTGTFSREILLCNIV